MFHDALQVEPEARAAYVAHRCRRDTSLRREVEGLLAVDGRAFDGAFLRRVIVAAAREIAASDAAGPGLHIMRESVPDRRFSR